MLLRVVEKENIAISYKSAILNYKQTYYLYRAKFEVKLIANKNAFYHFVPTILLSRMCKTNSVFSEFKQLQTIKLDYLLQNLFLK